MGTALDEYTPDHSTISRTRRLIDLDTHREVFGGVLTVLADRGFLKGQRIAIDATTLEANAAMRSIVRRDTGESYEEFLRGLAKKIGAVRVRDPAMTSLTLIYTKPLSSADRERGSDARPAHSGRSSRQSAALPGRSA